MTMRRRLLLLALALPAFIGTPAAANALPAALDTSEVELTAHELADKIVDYASTFLGTPYRYGANGPKRFDCTGYTRYVFHHFGFFNLSRSAKDQARDGREVDISDFRNLQKGDILLLGSRRNPKVVGHVGIFTGLDTARNDPKFIHASNHGVRNSSIYTESYYANRLLGARRILPDFEDYDAVFDSTAVYAFEPEIGARIAPDSLVLASGDRRIVLFENGKWALVAEDGTLVIPEAGGRIILTGDGNWAPVREAKVTIPTSALKPDPRDLAPDDEPAKAKAGSGTAGTTDSGSAGAGGTAGTSGGGTAGAGGSGAVAAGGDTTATDQAQPSAAAQPEQVYHTVKKGDTLYKIARDHHTTVAKLCQLNGITSSTILKIGRKLRVK